MNKCKLSSPYLASYTDFMMRKALKGVSEAETEQRLEKIVRLFACLNEKDVFFHSYTQFLSVRLLNNLSVSDEAEQILIAKIKVECGHSFVSGVTNMFNDIAMSHMQNEEFKNLTHKGAPEGIITSVQVLRTGCWIQSTEENIILPNELKPCTEAFKVYYNKKHTGRILSWMLQHGFAELKSCYAAKQYTFVVSSM